MKTTAELFADAISAQFEPNAKVKVFATGKEITTYEDGIRRTEFVYTDPLVHVPRQGKDPLLMLKSKATAEGLEFYGKESYVSEFPIGGERSE